MAPVDKVPFFTQPRPVRQPDTVVLGETTRYLCAAAYVTNGFARRVTNELTDNEHRAVVPSVGFDVGPVLRHCFRARNLLLARDGLLTAVLVIGFAMTPYLWVWLAVGGGLTVGALLWSRNRKLAAAAGISVTVVLLLLLSGRSGLPSPTDSLASLQEGDTPTYGTPDDSGLSGSGLLLRLAIVAGLTLAAYTWWQLTVYRVLTDDLASGVRHQLPAVPPGRIGKRVEAVSAAQWGNMTLHAHRDPFLGAGQVIHSWSMSLELRGESGTECTVDPYELQQHVRARLEAMRSDDLPEQERISGLIVVDHIVANGERSVPDPLISDQSRIPYARASDEAVEAIIRHPQGSLRYYLHAVVGAEGRDVRIDDRLVTPAQDQEIAVSTFLYVAVEGGMLYLEFVATVLPPLRDHVHVIDRLVPERNLTRALKDALNQGFMALITAPFNLAAGLAATYGTPQRMDRASRDCREQRVYDYGARLSVRQLASAGRVQNYLQQLDAEKYYKLVERAITGSVLSFLEDEGVDTSEYRSRAMTVLNNGVMITGGTVTGPVAGGTQATATMTGPAPVDGGAAGAGGGGGGESGT